MNFKLARVDAVIEWMKSSLMSMMGDSYEYFQLAERYVQENKNIADHLIDFLKKADFNSIDTVKTSLNGTAGCFDTSSEKEAMAILNKVAEVDDVYLLGALFLIKVDDRLLEAEPVAFKARTVGEFFENFWNNIFKN